MKTDNTMNSFTETKISLGTCRGIHIKINNPVKEKIYCSNCDSLVEKQLGRHCPCCHEQIHKKRKYGLLKKLLNKVLEDAPLILEAYNNYPLTKTKLFFQVYNQGLTYSIPVQVVARYAEAYRSYNLTKKKTPDAIINFWDHHEIRESQSLDAVLAFCDRRIKAVGIFR